MGYKKHFRVHHGEHEFARSNCHIISHSIFQLCRNAIKLSVTGRQEEKLRITQILAELSSRTEGWDPIHADLRDS